MEENSSRVSLNLPGANKLSKHNEITIRQVQDTDYEALARFFEENNRPEITRHFHPFPLDSQTAYQIVCTNHLDRHYIASWNGQIIGLCMLRGWDEGFEMPSFGVFVDYRHHGLGLGRQMTEFAIAESRKLGYHSIRLSVYTSNEVALRLYASLDFREMGRELVFVAGESDIKLTMVKDLK